MSFPLHLLRISLGRPEIDWRLFPFPPSVFRGIGSILFMVPPFFSLSTLSRPPAKRGCALPFPPGPGFPFPLPGFIPFRAHMRPFSPEFPPPAQTLLIPFAVVWTGTNCLQLLSFSGHNEGSAFPHPQTKRPPLSLAIKAAFPLLWTRSSSHRSRARPLRFQVCLSPRETRHPPFFSAALFLLRPITLCVLCYF